MASVKYRQEDNKLEENSCDKIVEIPIPRDSALIACTESFNSVGTGKAV